MQTIREPDHELVIHWLHEPEDGRDENVDIEIRAAGKRYSATVHTVRNIVSLLGRWRETGERPSSYFRVPDAVVVDEPISEALIRRIVADAVASGDLDEFARLEECGPD
jgi:hypothetical protein